MIAAMAALCGIQDDIMFGGGSGRKYLDRTHCADCGADVGPGRPGRRCEECRKPAQPRQIEFVQ